MSVRQSLSPHVEEVLSPCAALWREAHGLREQRLLRLAILRDLIRAMHAERSKLLALSQPDRAEALRRIEPRIEALRTDPLAADSLPELVSETEISKPPPTSIPASLEEAVGQGKFGRYDRQWEAEIAAEAHRLGWGFWTLEAWIDIMRAEGFHHSLNQGLWPNGIVLFVESCSDTADAPESPPGQTLWKGRWLVTHSGDKNPFDLKLGPLPGAVHPPLKSDWRALFAPEVG